MNFNFEITTEELFNLVKYGESKTATDANVNDAAPDVKSNGIIFKYDPHNNPENPFDFINMDGSQESLNMVVDFIYRLSTLDLGSDFLYSLNNWCNKNGEEAFFLEAKATFKLLAEELEKQKKDVESALNEPVIDPTKVFDPETKVDLDE